MAQKIVYDIFAATDEEFALLFLRGTDIAFIDEVYANGNSEQLDAALNAIWKRSIEKSRVQGIHGTLFYELATKKVYYPTRRDREAINPRGSRLR
jgi:hypothetical protein